MKNILFSAILLVLAALSASAQTPAANIFDGHGLPSGAWDLNPEPVKAAPGGPALVAVVAQLRSRERLKAAVEALRAKHGFVLDLTIRPKLLGAEKPFAILPVPAPETPALALVLGLVPAGKADAFCEDEAVRCLRRGEALGRPTVREPAEIIRARGQALSALPGVLWVGVGPDCGLESDHNHIRAHEDAVILVHEPGADATALRQSALKAAPELKEGRLAVFEAPAAPLVQPRRYTARRAR